MANWPSLIPVFSAGGAGDRLVQTKSRIDYEQVAVIRFNVTVVDTGVPQLTSTAQITVDVQNTNDNDPVFERPEYAMRIAENSPAGTVVGVVRAHDADGGAYGQLTYTIVGEHSGSFAIDPDTGALTVGNSSALDRETEQEVSLTAIATDRAPEVAARRSTTVPVQITILDVNDNEPEFLQRIYHATVAENAALHPPAAILQVSATDPDEGAAGDVKYAILTDNVGGIFRLDANSGILYPGASLIGKSGKSVVVVCWGSSSNSFQHPVVVTTGGHRGAKRTHGPPAPVATEINGIDERQYRIEIEARDGLGAGPHSDTATIMIEIQSINQHRPVFIMPALYNATVELPERTNELMNNQFIRSSNAFVRSNFSMGLAIGSAVVVHRLRSCGGIPSQNLAAADYLVMTVKATDNDSGANGKVLYYLQVNSQNVQETDEFSINEMSGELRIRRQLDRKRQSRYELILVARDQGTPAWFETLRFLTVLLVDVNENYPEFPDASNPYKFFVAENGPRDVRIGKIQAFLDNPNPSIYYYVLLGNEDGAFYVDKTSGDLYTNRSIDREVNDMYLLYVLASKQPDLYISERDRIMLSTEQLERNATVAKVWVSVLDVNDNAPVFRRDTYYAGISSRASINELVTLVNATDRDLGVNATLDLFIRGSFLYKFGATKTTGSIVPSPFAISKDGRVLTANYMAEYNQDRFVLEIVAKEVESPEREAVTKVHVWIFNPEQLVRMILSRPPAEVHQDREEIVSELGNATQRLIIVDEIRYHVDSLGRIRMDWCDMYFHAVDTATQMIVPVEEILREIDAKYDFLQDYNAGYSILNVVPAYAATTQDDFDLALAALIALLIVLFVGAVSFIVFCCCLKHWSISIPSETRRKDALIKKQIIEDLNTTENPLWIEQKLKLYEEQELTMQVFSEPDMSQQQSMNNSNSTNSAGSPDPSSQLSLTLGLDHQLHHSHPLQQQQQPHLRRDSYDMSQAGDNTYATIQPRNYGTSNLSTVLGSSLTPAGGGALGSSGVTSATSSSEVADYATLRNSRAPSLFEFRGSTFQVQQPGGGDQPDYVTELM
ncbi:hypothetical protein AND_010057 [Anopheles darlingi]|uniref:Cadherin domain-containing protein n=1 Tax=Anopheles darlingi TaxID=43151 RepID=W5J6C9_ANODA|nr:hypothetical protein AND_010057 [Anopheles darlingi]